MKGRRRELTDEWKLSTHSRELSLLWSLLSVCCLRGIPWREWNFNNLSDNLRLEWVGVAKIPCRVFANSRHPKLQTLWAGKQSLRGLVMGLIGLSYWFSRRHTRNSSRIWMFMIKFIIAEIFSMADGEDYVDGWKNLFLLKVWKFLCFESFPKSFAKLFMVSNMLARCFHVHLMSVILEESRKSKFYNFRSISEKYSKFSNLFFFDQSYSWFSTPLKSVPQ